MARLDSLVYERGTTLRVQASFSVELEDQFTPVTLASRFCANSWPSLLWKLWREHRRMNRLERLSRPWRKQKGWA